MAVDDDDNDNHDDDLGLGFVGKKWIRIFGHESIRIFEYLQVRVIMLYKKIKPLRGCY